MTESESLEQKEQRLSEEIPAIRIEWVNHMQVRHNGRRATSCHTCINFDYTIAANEYTLGEIRREMARRRTRP